MHGDNQNKRNSVTDDIGAGVVDLVFKKVEMKTVKNQDGRIPGNVEAPNESDEELHILCIRDVGRGVVEGDHYGDESIASQEENVMQGASEEEIGNTPEYVRLVVINHARALAMVIDMDHDWDANNTEQDINSTEASDYHVGDCVEFSVEADGKENQNVGKD